jgi:acyl-coenzyme A synthetase/AMP-(fatty) acid ligase
MATIPLINGYGSGAALAYRDGGAIMAGRFVEEATQLAALLPDRGHVINLCADRYRFTVGFAAALLRGQVSLLPPNETADTIERIVAAYPGVYCLSDREETPMPATLELVRFPERLAGESTRRPVPVLPETQAAVVVFTSGSTGEPVPYSRTWGDLARVASAEIEALGLRSQPGIALLGTVPQQHVFGLEATVMLVLQGGFAMHARRPFYPADIHAALASLPRPRGLVTSPLHLRVLLEETDGLPPADFLLCATAPLAPQLAAQAEARFSAPLYEIYGCTESGGIATRRTVDTAEWRAMEGVSLRSDGASTWVKGGYFESEVLLADVIELRGSHKFLLHGRKADLVNIAGKRTSLAYLNYHLNSIEGVRDGAFVVPDQPGEGVIRLMAFVVAPGRTSEDIVSELRRRIDAAFLPRPLCLVDALPRNATGKLPRQELDDLVRKAG